MRANAGIALLMLVWIGVASGKTENVPGQPAMAVLDWLQSIGLEDVFRFVRERHSAGYQLVLDSAQLSTVVAEDARREIYIRLFTKVVSESNVAPNMVQLVVIDHAGWCDPPVYEHSIRLEKNGFTIESKLIQKGGGVRCSLDMEYIVKYRKDTRVATTDSGIASVPPAIPLTSKFSTQTFLEQLQKRFSSRGAIVAVTGSSDAWLSMLITGLRSEVIADQPYWERLQLMIVLESGDPPARIRLILDGKYGAGLAVPGEHGYTDMEPTYTANLLSYGKRLTIALSSGAMDD